MSNSPSISYGQFEAKRTEWVKCLSGEDRHTIVTQLVALMWNTATYRVINESRRLATPDGRDGIQQSGLLHVFIDSCFFNSQMSNIRRLCDEYDLVGRRGVFSLIALIRDMKKHCVLFTRRHLLMAENRYFDREKLVRDREDWFHQRAVAKETAGYVPSELDLYGYDKRNAEIDELSGVTAASRSDEDSVSPNIFKSMEKRVVDACDLISEYVNKFIAHAASPESRQQVQADEAKITLGHLRDAERVLCQVTNFVAIYLLTRTTHTFLATPQYDLFRFIDRPLVTKDQIPTLQKVWDDFADEEQSWTHITIKDFI